MIGGYADMQKWVAIFNLNSSTGPIPPEYIPPGARFTPNIVLFNNVSAAVGVSGFYEGNSSAPGGIINATFKILVTSDGSGQACNLTIATPIPAYFTNSDQALPCDLPQIVLASNTVTGGNTSSGWGGDIQANTAGSGAITIYFETAQVNTEYLLTFSSKFVLQAVSVREAYQETKKMNVKALEHLEKIKRKMLNVD